jgi:Ion channel
MKLRRLRRSKIRFATIFKNPFFWILTIVGNSIMLLGSLLLMWCESSTTAATNSYQFIDYLLWSAGIVTTIGYGDYMAQTYFGKFVVLVLMLFGTLFLWLYMAFLVNALFIPEFMAMEREFEEIEKEMHEFKLNQLS